MKTKKILSASFWYTFSNFLLKGISFITVPIFARIMTQAELGQFSILTSWISLLSPIITISLYNSVILAKYDYKDEYDRFLSSISILGLIATSILYLIVSFGMGVIVKLIKLPPYAIHIMFLYMLAIPGIELLQAKLRANLQYIPVVIITIVSTVISVGTALILTVNSEDHFKARVLGTYIPLIIIYLTLLIKLILRGKSFSWRYNRYALIICIPLVIHELAGNIMHSSDRIMIQQLCNDESVALYSVAYSCGAMINILRNSVQSAWYPWFFEKLNTNSKREIKKISYLYVLVFAFMGLGVVMFAPEIMMVLGGAQYRVACYVIPPVVLSYFVTVIYSLYSGLERYYKRQKWFALFAFISASCNIILNYVFIPRYGYIAAAYTTLASSCIECLLHYYNSRKLGCTDIYDNRFNLIIVIVCALCSILIAIAYEKFAFRLLFSGAIAVVIGFLFTKEKDNIKLNMYSKL